MSEPLPLLLRYCASKGHRVFTRGLYNLNIIGQRTDDNESDKFNDLLSVAYKDEQGWVERSWAWTTDPGTYWREHPMRVEGTAILCPGQYSSYKLGRHRGAYPALVQTAGSVKIWRDNNRDAVLNMDAAVETDTGYYGINIHKSSSRDGGSEDVSRWSAGCQVASDPADWDCFMSLVNRSAAIYGPRFTYTLIEAPSL